MKRGMTFSLLVISVLILSIGLVIAESNETEAETCAASISINFNQDVYRSGDSAKIVTRVLDSQGNGLSNYPFHFRIYASSEDRWHLSEYPDPEYTNEQGYVEHSSTVDYIPEGDTEKILYKVYTEETSSCSAVEDTAEIEYKYREDTRPEPTPEPESEPVPTVCAAEIKINWDKSVYYVGDIAKIVIEVLDSQGNHLPNYLFYGQTCDDQTGECTNVDSVRTDADGYFKAEGEIGEEEGIGRSEVWIEAIGNCPAIPVTMTKFELKKEKSEPVPCGIGSCIPIEEEPEETKVIPEDKIFYKCDGCELGDKCYPMGYRKEGQYCSDDNEFVSQVDKQCDNSFECESNVCISGECVGEGLMKRIIKWFKRMFGGGEDEDPGEPGLEMCSKLLIEKDIGDNEYVKSEYGADEHTQVPVHSEDGANVGTVKCCSADYSTGMVIVCPYDGADEVRNSLKWILGGGVDDSYELREHKGERVVDISDGGILVWTNENYLIASGGKPNSGDKIVEEIVKAYFKKYPSSFDLTMDDIPYVEPKPMVFCTAEDDELAGKCKESKGDLQSDGHPDKDCEVYTGCL